VNLSFLVAFAFSGPLSAWSVSGMETALYTFIVSLIAWSVLSRRVYGAALLCSIATVTRPEAAAHAFFALLFSHERKWLLPVALSLFAFSSYLFFNRFYYGDWMPYAGAFKMTTVYYDPPISTRLHSFRKFSFHFLPIMVFSAANLVHALSQIVTTKKLASTSLYLASAGWAQTLLYIFVGPSADYGRYFLHLMPYHLIAAVWFATHLAGRVRFRRFDWALIAFVVVCLPATWQGWNWHQNTFEKVAGHQQARMKMGRFIDENIATDVPIFSSDIGMVAYKALNHEFVDVYGLVNRQPHTFVAQNDLPGFESWLQNRGSFVIADTVYELKPQAIHILSNPTRYFKSATGDIDFAKGIVIDEILFSERFDDRLEFSVFSIRVN
jgi:hypothetical protein